jgi:hypothetical protein
LLLVERKRAQQEAILQLVAVVGKILGELWRRLVLFCLFLLAFFIILSILLQDFKLHLLQLLQVRAFDHNLAFASKLWV